MVSSKSSFIKKCLQIPLWQQMLIAFILGIALGLGYPPFAKELAPIGQLFINAIQLLIIPVVFVSITCGVLSLRNQASMGRITLKTLAFYAFTMAIAAGVGILLAEFTKPGEGLDLRHLSAEAAVINLPQISFDNLISGLIPANMIATFSVNTMLLQVIVIAVLLGLSMIRAGDHAKPAEALFKSLFSIMLQFAQIIMRFAPVGIFCLMAITVGTFGTAMLIELMILIATIYAGCLIQMLVIYSGILKFMARLNPLPFFRGMADAMVFAFSTTSSAATLPVTLRCTEYNLGVNKSITEFAIPLGATINMNGASIYIAVAAIFSANLYGIDLQTWQFALIIMTSMLASVGAAGVPGGTLFVMALVLGSIGVPLTAIAIIAAIDRAVDMIVTTLNITGDAVAAVVVAKSENMLDESIYYAKNKTPMES